MVPRKGATLDLGLLSAPNSEKHGCNPEFGPYQPSSTVTRFSWLFDKAAGSPVAAEENQLYFLTSLTQRF